jgi:hypothetical protein
MSGNRPKLPLWFVDRYRFGPLENAKEKIGTDHDSQMGQKKWTSMIPSKGLARRCAKPYEGGGKLVVSRKDRREAQAALRSLSDGLGQEAWSS